MVFDVFIDDSFVVIGVTIKAAVQAGVVDADVDAFRAHALLSLVPVLVRFDSFPGNPLNQSRIDAAGFGNRKGAQIQGLGTGFHF